MDDRIEIWPIQDDSGEYEIVRIPEDQMRGVDTLAIFSTLEEAEYELPTYVARCGGHGHSVGDCRDCR